MGGDGGVIASNRRYLRGAGTACHTADAKRNGRTGVKYSVDDDNCADERTLEQLRTCALTGETLPFTSSSGHEIVACAFGKLYGREAAVEALLLRKRRKKKAEGSTSSDLLGPQVRGLRDLYAVRFCLREKTATENKTHLSGSESASSSTSIPICPITGEELVGKQPAFLIVKSDEEGSSSLDNMPNVISERALKEMSSEALRTEFGDFNKDDMIRLAPPPLEQARMREKLIRRRKEEKESFKKSTTKSSSAMGRKRKHVMAEVGKNCGIVAATSDGVDHTACAAKKGSDVVQRHGDAVSTARSNFAKAMNTNSVLSDLFSQNKTSISEKEKKDNLFARS